MELGSNESREFSDALFPMGPLLSNRTTRFEMYAHGPTRSALLTIRAHRQNVRSFSTAIVPLYLFVRHP